MSTPTPEAMRAAALIAIEIDKRTGTVLASWDESITAEIIDREMGGWRPIDECPKEMSYILAADPLNHRPWIAMRKHGGGWYVCDNHANRNPTHFRELPTPPNQ